MCVGTVYVLNMYIVEEQSEPSQTSKMERFMKINNSSKPLTIFAKCSILYVREGSEHCKSFGGKWKPRYGTKWVNDIRVILFLLCSSTELKFIGKFYGSSRCTNADVKIFQYLRLHMEISHQNTLHFFRYAHMIREKFVYKHLETIG